MILYLEGVSKIRKYIISLFAPRHVAVGSKIKGYAIWISAFINGLLKYPDQIMHKTFPERSLDDLYASKPKLSWPDVNLS